MKCQILTNVKFRGSLPWRQVAAVVKFWNELRMSCDCQISAELRIAAAVKFYMSELRIELQKLDAAIIYIYISPFIITQICGSCNFMKLSNFLPPAF